MFLKSIAHVLVLGNSYWFHNHQTFPICQNWSWRISSLSIDQSTPAIQSCQLPIFTPPATVSINMQVECYCLTFDKKKRHLYSQILHLRLDDLIFISKNILTSFHKSSWTFVLNDRCIFVQPFLLCINWRSYGFNCNFPFLCLCCYYNHVNHTFKISAWAAETNTVTHIIVASTTPSHVRKDNNEKDGMVSLISLSYNWMGFH